MASRWGWVPVVAVAALAMGAGALVGYLAGQRSSPPPASPGGTTLWIAAAGTLGTAFPILARTLANETPGVSVPLAAQEYEGSIAALESVGGHAPGIDVAAAADYRLIPELLEPSGASWEVAFATSPEVLAYDPGVPALAGINGTNWATKLEAPGVTLGVANASTDPNGYNAIFVLELDGILTGGNASSVYGHFFTTPPGALAEPNPSTTKVEPETAAAQLLSAHEISAYLIYRAYALEHRLSFVDLDPRIDLGSSNASSIAFDARATTEILGRTPGPTTLVEGAPAAYAVTVPDGASNVSLGDAFVHLLLSPLGSATLAAEGFNPIDPGWADFPSALPPILQPDVVVLPPGLPDG